MMRIDDLLSHIVPKNTTYTQRHAPFRHATAISIDIICDTSYIITLKMPWFLMPLKIYSRCAFRRLSRQHSPRPRHYWILLYHVRYIITLLANAAAHIAYHAHATVNALMLRAKVMNLIWSTDDWLWCCDEFRRKILYLLLLPIAYIYHFYAIYRAF